MGKTENGQVTAPCRPEASPVMDQAMGADEIYEKFDFVESGPDWRVTVGFQDLEAEQLIRSFETNKVDMDPAIAAHLLKFKFDGDFNKYKAWYLGKRSLLSSPEATCPGMSDAAAMLADAISDNKKIGVYCDYDLDGTSAGEVFRRGLSPYGADLHYGWANAQRGFGLTNEFVEEAHKEGCEVLVTLDCGSTQQDQVKLAQDLGMKVIVVDHHHAEENPAEFHLNPIIHEPQSSMNTGAQLAWKLGAAVQIAEEGEIRDDHYEEPMKLAGMGCLADMGSAALPENRAFFWGAADKPVPGVVEIAEALEEDPGNPGGMILTQAVLNLPKRTPNVSAEDVGKLLAAETREEAKPIAEKLLASYEQAKPVRKKMAEDAVRQIGEANWDGDEPVRPDEDNMIGFAVIDDQPEYAGYSGVIANSAARKAYKPVAVFVNKGKDEFGQETYKFSMRNSGTKKDVEIGALIEDPDMQGACTLKKLDESGEEIFSPTLGGHADVTSGTCTAGNLDAVKDAMSNWAKGIGKKKFYSEKFSSSEFLSERRVPADRLREIEKQAKQMGPYGMGPQEIKAPRGKKPAEKQYHMPAKISAVGVLGELTDDPGNPNFKCSTLTLANGDTREARFPADEEAPVGKMCEWVLKVDGSDSPYYLRKFHDPTA